MQIIYKKNNKYEYGMVWCLNLISHDLGMIPDVTRLGYALHSRLFIRQTCRSVSSKINHLAGMFLRAFTSRSSPFMLKPLGQLP